MLGNYFFPLSYRKTFIKKRCLCNRESTQISSVSPPRRPLRIGCFPERYLGGCDTKPRRRAHPTWVRWSHFRLLRFVPPTCKRRKAMQQHRTACAEQPASKECVCFSWIYPRILIHIHDRARCAGGKWRTEEYLFSSEYCTCSRVVVYYKY